MKLLKLIALGILLTVASSASAQLSINVNIGKAPAWGPSGYNDVRYYYLPDVEAYYDVHTSMFIYISGNKWIRRSHLPSRYHNYDLYRGYKVVMKGYKGNTPYYNFKNDKNRYKKGYHGKAKKTIEARKDNNKNKNSRSQVKPRKQAPAHNSNKPNSQKR